MTEILRAGFAPTLLSYAPGWLLQQRIHGEVVSGTRPNTLILCEHESVYTAGKRTEPQHRPRDGSAVIDVDRGGSITWHGPGQLVGYPIIRLAEPRNVVGYMRTLEEVLIRALATWGISGERIAGRSGVWVLGGGSPAKIAAIGLRVSRGVTMHGFSLNCSNSPEGFARITPCGLSDVSVTSISDLLGQTMTPEDCADTVTAHFLTVTGNATTIAPVVTA
ncbi:lipoyl(octanoyl) transferase LipB [Klugiella xanthotipulae]|uniref:Octanoyltransferase n=1 Tax=Klugiella xanthotipulae TaxID=244735 RepID=A0A543HRW4_9MICO|nr:lipoyl(octanoyl) transferase LipB [Klugiella xanthotipulae]TQM61068.1 lipoyl(octanoyl) transferase [Klugiella xanthotipulae]